MAKVGTSTLTDGGASLNRAAMRRIAAQVITLRSLGARVVLVSSGAVAAGRERLQHHGEMRDLAAKQTLAAIGQARLMQEWGAIFDEQSIDVAQALLTKQDLSQRLGYLNARTTLLNLLELHVLPIVNENDVVAVNELRIGDNDHLSALVANLVDADLLVLLTDTEGLYSADPRVNPAATLIPTVHEVTSELERVAGASRSAGGTGGMQTKLSAARSAVRWGTTVVITSGSREHSLTEAAQGSPHGTWFPAVTALDGRRRWLATGVASHGEVAVDGGAATALKTGGKSLLSAGICGVAGKFARGDAVLIRDLTGLPFACGLANYDAKAIELIAGHRSEEIADRLGYSFGPEVIHRNNLVML